MKELIQCVCTFIRYSSINIANCLLDTEQFSKTTVCCCNVIPKYSNMLAVISAKYTLSSVIVEILHMNEVAKTAQIIFLIFSPAITVLLQLNKACV